MIYIANTEEWPEAGWVNFSEANQWVHWLALNIPDELDVQVRRRLNSNLKHLIVGLELKAGLVLPHANRGNRRPILFESYFQNLVLEYCASASSILEGLGSAHWLSQNGYSGEDNRRVFRNEWQPALCAVYDPNGEHGLELSLQRTLLVRDRLHQDNVGARADIDWHVLTYEQAFLPASHAIRTLLRHQANSVPPRSNLNLELP